MLTAEVDVYVQALVLNFNVFKFRRSCYQQDRHEESQRENPHQENYDGGGSLVEATVEETERAGYRKVAVYGHRCYGEDAGCY